MKKRILYILQYTFLGFMIGIKCKALVPRPSCVQEQKITQYYHILNQWLDLRQRNQTLASYFRERNYNKIAIYGMRELGQRLYCELKFTDMELFLIDKAADKIYFEEDILSPADGIPEVNVIIVTAAYYFSDIKKKLAKRVSCPIISIQEVIDNI